MRRAALLWRAKSVTTLLATSPNAAELLPSPKSEAGYPGALKPGETPPAGQISTGTYMTPTGRKWVRINESAIAAESHQYHVANTDKDPGPPYDPVTDAHAKEWIELLWPRGEEGLAEENDVGGLTRDTLLARGG